MALEKIARNIPKSLWNVASEKLVDITLNSTNASKMPSDIAKRILYYWQRDQLATEVGLHLLLEASMILEPEKTIDLMEEFGLSEIVVLLRGTLQQ